MSEIGVRRGPGFVATQVLAAIIVLLGLPMVIMGADLAALGGSIYYVICGAFVVAAGILMIVGRPVGALIYLAALLGTWLWAFYEVGLDWVGLMPRVFGPTLIGIAVVFTLPVLRRVAARRVALKNNAPVGVV